MKCTKRFLLAATLLGAPALFAAGAGQQNAYEQAVLSYVEAATKELRAIRNQVDESTAKLDATGKQAYAEIYRGLDQCDATVAQLRVAVPREFDPIKQRYEAARTQMIATLEAVRKNPPAPAPVVQSEPAK